MNKSTPLDHPRTLREYSPEEFRRISKDHPGEHFAWVARRGVLIGFASTMIELYDALPEYGVLPQEAVFDLLNDRDQVICDPIVSQE